MQIKNHLLQNNDGLPVSFISTPNKGAKYTPKYFVGSTYFLGYNNLYRYKITLNYIGAAGKKPFTKTAYKTVAIYKNHIFLTYKFNLCPFH